MNKPVEEMSIDEIKQRLHFMDRAHMIDDDAAVELMAITKELLRRLVNVAAENRLEG